MFFACFLFAFSYGEDNGDFIFKLHDMTKKELNETECKIRNAAKKLFLEKGFKWTTTREIAQEAWVNFSLLNYHFWSKKELFDATILDTFKGFSEHLFLIINDPQTSFYDKIFSFCDNFFDFISENEKFFMFIQEEVANHPKEFTEKIQKDIEKMKNQINLCNSVFIEQYQKETHKNIDDFRVFFTNFLSIIIYPIISKSLFKILIGLEENQFQNFLKERKENVFKLIPHLLEV